jgi:hypothetical protein
MLTAVGPKRGNYCTSCYTGQYPVAFPRDEAAYLQLALKLDTSGNEQRTTSSEPRATSDQEEDVEDVEDVKLGAVER